MIIDTPQAIAACYPIVDELTERDGLVTVEVVPAMVALHDGQRLGDLRLPDGSRGKRSLTLPSGVTCHAMETSTPEAVSAALEEILRDDLNVDTSRLNRDSRLIDDAGLDSVAFAVGMVAIEDKLGVALTEEDLLTCDTVGDLEAAILAKVPAAQ